MKSKNRTTNDTEFEKLGDSLGFIVNGLARLMRNELENRLKEAGLTPTTWTVLMALLEEDRLSQTDLARRTFFDGATMTRALDPLEAKGYISRIRDEGDRRVQIVVLNEAGRDAALTSAKSGMEINDEAMAAFSVKEKDEFKMMLVNAMRHLADRNSDGAPYVV